MAIRLLSGETIDGGATFAGIITVNSSSSGDYVRMYGSSGTGKWDIYGSGNNLRISENTASGTGILTVDRGATFAGAVEVNGNLVVDGAGISTDFQLRRSASAAALLTINAPGGSPNGSVFSINGNSVMTLDENQNATFAGSIGVGGIAASGGYMVDIAPSGGNIIRSTRGTSVFGSYQSNNSDVYLGTISNNTFKIITNDTTAITINNSQNATFAGNVLIGATSAAAGVLVVDGNSANNIWVVGRDSDGTGSLSFRNAADNAYNARLEAVSGALKFETNGTLALTIDSSQNATFAGTLDVASTIYTAESLRFDGTGLNATDKKLYSPADGELQWFTHDLAGAHAFSVSHQGTRRVYLNTSGNSYLIGGNVGIGTTSPAEKLEVSGSIKVGNMKFEPTHGGRIGFNRNTATGAIYDSNYAAFQINGAYSGADFLEIQNYNSSGNFLGSVALKDGKLGIGTTSPSKKLHVYNTAAADVALLESTQAFSTLAFKSSTNTDTAVFGIDGGGNAYIENKKSTHPILFTTNSNERMRITSAGNVGIGTTDPEDKLEVAGGALKVKASANHVEQAYIKFGRTDQADGNFENHIKSMTGSGSTQNRMTFSLCNTSATGRVDLLTLDGGANKSYFGSGNVGIGTTDLGAEAKLAIGAINGNEGGQIVLHKGTSGTLAAHIDAYHSTNDYLRILSGTNTASSSAPFVFDLTNVRLGIGTTSPQSKLMVQGAGANGTVRIVPSSANAEASIGFYQDTTGTTSSTRWIAGVGGWGNTNDFTIGYGDGGPDLLIDTSGNVGIGTTSPSGKLNVFGATGLPATSGTTFTGTMRLQVTGYGTTLDFGSEGPSTGKQWLQATDAGDLSVTYPLLLNPNGGNVGIGTTSPSSFANYTNVTIQGGSTGSNLDFKNASGTRVAAIVSNPGADFGIETNEAVPLLFKTNSTERMRITSAGNVGIGNTSPSQKLHVTGSILASSDVVAFSDIKLKENIKTLDGSKVYNMRGVSFTRKDTGKDSSGVIAQEIQKIAPELVTDNDGTLSVAYGNLTGYLIEAIKELKAEIKELKKQIK